MSHRIRFSACFAITALALTVSARADDPLFDLPAIMNDPVDVTVLDRDETEDGIVFETLEYTTRVVDDEPERVQGIYAYPSGGKSLPAVYWSQGGMARASRYFPEIFARKGYACFVITLPHAIRNSFRIPFDTQQPDQANLTLLARDQLRGITVLSQRPEIDPDRMAVAGASYGGVFATLIAGVDPRVKAGMSFFGGGHHDLGTSLPQFLKMASLDDVAVWNRTIDPAFRLRDRDIPFMWGVAFNDHWFHFPAVMRTYAEAASADKRVTIMPHWQHGFAPPIDQALVDFLDTALTRTRAPYNQPQAIEISRDGDDAIATFTWTGDNRVTEAQVIASYGHDTPWLGWPHRAAFVFPARIDGQHASARLPIPAADLPVIVWGNLTDERQVVTSTPAVTLGPDDLASLPVDGNVELNCFKDGTFSDEVLAFYRMSGEPLAGRPDRQVMHSGGQSLRIDADSEAAEKGLVIRHFHSVPGLAHRLSVQLRAERPVSVSVALTPVRPRSWQSQVVQGLVARDGRLAPLLPRWSDPVEAIAVTAKVGTNWQQVTLDVPAPTTPVDGYTLNIRQVADDPATWWIDTLRMQPIWPQ